MPRPQRAASTYTSLPPCEGPKLNAFSLRKSRIEWLGMIGEGSEGYVFHARIKGKEYAIKVFKFFDPCERSYFWEPLLGKETPLQTAAYYTDPFFAECRAYGQIHEAIKKKKLRSTVAVPCHGFLFLTKSDEKSLLANYDIDLGRDEIDLDFQREAIGGNQARAIVKSLASNDPGVNKDSLRRILQGIEALNKLKLYIMDVRLDNYRDGMVVDFGSAWTEPYPPLDAMDNWNAASARITDSVLFDEMVKEEEIPNPGGIRATPNYEYRKKLRPREGLDTEAG